MTRSSHNASMHVPVDITADMSGLSEKDQRVIKLLVRVANLIDDIYLQQSKQLPMLGRHFFDNDRQKNFYPEDMTVELIETYLDTNPDKRDAIMNPFTVVVGSSDELKAVPYSDFYDVEMQTISELFAQAAELTADHDFKKFLELKSEAFLTNQYRASDIAWIHAHNGPLEFTVGPYESYADKLFGVKRAFESVLGVVLVEDTQVARTFQGYVSRFDAMLGLRYDYSTKTTLTPMVVMDQVYASGESLYDSIPMAYNLPNDTDIHAEVGSKKVFIKNVMSAKFELITKEIARRMLRFEDVECFDLETYLRFVIGHESAHGLSFHFDGQTFGPSASAVEEGKADVFGMWFLYFLADKGVFGSEVADSAVIQNLTDSLRQIRFGTKGAHAVGSIIQLNWFIEKRALIVSERGFDFTRPLFRETIPALADELYALAKSGNQSDVEAFIAQWGTLPESIEVLLPRLSDIPVDIDPIFSF